MFPTRVSQQQTNYHRVRSMRADMRGPVGTLPVGPTQLTAAVPPIGTVAQGELLVSANDRSMWLGVDSSVDPFQAILISDITSLLQADIDNLEIAKQYTRDQCALRAPLVHQHPHTDISDWDAAIAAALAGGGSAFKKGMIMMFSGSPTWIGNNTGDVDLTGWQLCDGTNQTPNLANRFIIGHGDQQSGTSNTINPAALKTTAAAGKHKHGGATQSHKLVAAELPNHSHPYDDDGTWNGKDGHRHLITDFGSFGTFWTNSPGTGVSQSLLSNSGVDKWSDAGVVDITIGVNVSSQLAHSHPITEEQDHTHEMPADIYQAIPWFALAYIMKL